MGKFDDALAAIIKRKSAVESELADLESGWQHFTKHDGVEVEITQDLIVQCRAEIADWDKLIAQIKTLNA